MSRDRLSSGSRTWPLVLTLVCAASLTGCPPPPPDPGFADAGRSLHVYIGTVVWLDATGSNLPSGSGGELLDFRWGFYSWPKESESDIFGRNGPLASFIPDVPGIYRFELWVEASGTRSRDRVTITAEHPMLSTNPNAHAGSWQYVEVGQTVALDARRSWDPGGRPLRYTWSMNEYKKPEGSVAVLHNESWVNPTFVADAAGEYEIYLDVHAGVDGSHDAVTVVAAASPRPTADAGPDQSVSTETEVVLDGSGSWDPAGRNLSYRWRMLARPDASAAALVGAESVSPSFYADQDGVYVVQLEVDNGTCSSGDCVERDEQEYLDRVTVVADSGNAAPVAVVGEDQRVLTEELLMVQGADSSDADGDPLEYDWELVSYPGFDPPPLSFSLPDGDKAYFTPLVEGSYVLRLVVNDGLTNSRPAVAVVTAKAANDQPVADAGADEEINTGLEHILDGSGSSDPDYDPLSWAWVLTVKPAGSGAALVNADSCHPRITPDVEGDYGITLTVSDGIAESAPDDVTLTATAPGLNQPPIADAGIDREAPVETEIFLDGTGSYDPDGDDITYAWTQADGPISVTLVGCDTAEPMFFAPAAGTYIFHLVVNDGNLDSVADEVRIYVMD